MSNIPRSDEPKWTPTDVHFDHPTPPEHTESVPSAGSNVAVIAIHGVGRHAVGASADAVTTLLLSLEKNENAAQRERLYPGFISTSIDVPLQPVKSPHDNVVIANQRNQPSLWDRFVGIFDERRGFLATLRKMPIMTRPDTTGANFALTSLTEANTAISSWLPK